MRKGRIYFEERRQTMESSMATKEPKQVLCKRCGGIKEMFVDGKKIESEAALRYFGVAPDAWCIC